MLFVFFGVPEHEFQASRFSVSGREVPLEPMGRAHRHAAHASPCMFPRLGRDVENLIFWSRICAWKLFSCDSVMNFAPTKADEGTILGGDSMVEKVHKSLCCCCGHLVLGTASGLEAFSREPPCNSVGALAARQTPETRGMAGEFLSYYPLLPSRHLRDPFTISFVFIVFSGRKRRALARQRGSKDNPLFRSARTFLAIPS